MTNNIADNALLMAISFMPVIASISDDDASAFCIAAIAMLAIYSVIEVWNFVSSGTRFRDYNPAAKIFFSIFVVIFACIAFCVVTMYRWLVKDLEDE